MIAHSTPEKEDFPPLSTNEEKLFNDLSQNKPVLSLAHYEPLNIEAVHHRNGSLLCAAATHNPNIAKALIEKGANLESILAYRCSRTPLMLAVQYQQDLVPYLIEKGADIHKIDSDGWSVINIAARYSHEKTVHLLLKKGANPNIEHRRNVTPLVRALTFNSSDVCRTFIDFGAEINIHFNMDVNPLMSACLYNPDLIIYMLEKGAVNGKEVLKELQLKKNPNSSIVRSQQILSSYFDKEHLVKEIIDKKHAPGSGAKPKNVL